VTGKTPPTARAEFFGEEYPFITPTDINGELRTPAMERFLSKAGRVYQESLLLPARAVSFVCIGATIGKVCLTNRPSFTNQQINSIVVDESRYDSGFIFYALKLAAPSIKAVAGGAATPIVNKSAFCECRITVPQLSIQRRIASILSAYDDLIENNTRRIAILEEMARALYREWFVHFRFPGHEKVKLVESPLGKIPEGWEINRLGAMAEDVRRSVQPTELAPDTPYFGLEHLPRRSIALSEWGLAREVQSTKLRFTRGEILFGKIRPYFHKVGVAPVDGVCSSDAIVISSKTSEDFPLVLACVSSDEFVAHATQTSQGTKMPRANWNVLRDYPVPVPLARLKAVFNHFIEDCVDEIHNLIFRIKNLRTTRDLLLPKLISGEIDVSAPDVAAPEATA
jgi:type I restriction enzyme S subunit